MRCVPRVEPPGLRQRATGAEEQVSGAVHDFAENITSLRRELMFRTYLWPETRRAHSGRAVEDCKSYFSTFRSVAKGSACRERGSEPCAGRAKSGTERESASRFPRQREDLGHAARVGLPAHSENG
jgi:hypothetical protein